MRFKKIKEKKRKNIINYNFKIIEISKNVSVN